jgi:hypothetical protein
VDSLQLHFYGYSLATEECADEYHVGIWILDEARWVWRAPMDMYSTEAAVMADVLRAAVENVSDTGTTGPHCHGCYARLHCPEHLLPAALGVSGGLAPYTRPGGITADNALQALGVYKSAADLVAQMRSQVEAWARENGGIPDGNGKVWRETQRAGATTLDAKLLRAEMPDVYDRYARPGKPGSGGFRWCHEKT